MSRRKVSGERASTAATTARRASGVAAMKASSPPAAAAISASTGSAASLWRARSIPTARPLGSAVRPLGGAASAGSRISRTASGRHPPSADPPGQFPSPDRRRASSASAPMVEPGLTAPTVGNRLPSTTMRSAHLVTAPARVGHAAGGIARPCAPCRADASRSSAPAALDRCDRRRRRAASPRARSIPKSEHAPAIGPETLYSAHARQAVSSLSVR